MMTDEEKGKLIGAIIAELHFSGREFDEGDTFFHFALNQMTN